MISGLPAHAFGEGLALARLGAAADALGLDLEALGRRSCVVVGSNGKGSTAMMTAAGLQAADRARVGLFVSPHVLDVSERLQLNAAPIAEDVATAHSQEVAAVAAALRADFGAMGAFEHLFLMAARWFATEDADAMVWEAGIGGRFDPVRLLRAPIGALTSLDLEHTALLGPTLEHIGCDKLDAFPEGAQVAHAGAWGPRSPIAAYVRVKRLRVAQPPPIDAVAPGAHQARNAGLAVWLVAAMTGSDAPAARAAVAAVRPPGRMERIAAAPTVFIDVCHTPDAARAAAAAFHAVAPGRASLIVAVSPGKAADAITQALAPGFARIWATQAQARGRPAEEIAALARRAAPHAAVETAPSVAVALSHARAAGAPILVAGSLYAAAEAKALALGRDPTTLWFL